LKEFQRLKEPIQPVIGKDTGIHRYQYLVGDPQGIKREKPETGWDINEDEVVVQLELLERPEESLLPLWKARELLF
jgi:hypothetical protein